MTNKRRRDYKPLERKMFLKTIAILLVALGFVFILLLVSRGNFADSFVSMLVRVFRMSFDSARSFYYQHVRYNMYIIIGTVALFFFILLRFLFSQFSRYLYEIDEGLDVLSGESEGDIMLSRDLNAMERKLSMVKRILNEREREARFAEQRKNDMVMYLAHDIKTPLTSVIGYLSLLDEARDMPSEQRVKYVSTTLDKAYRLEKLVDEFFEITRYNFQTAAPGKKMIDLYYMLAQLADEFYPLISPKGMKIKLELPEDMYIQGDPDLLARVFNNILKNAAAYGKSNSDIGIKAAVSEGKVTIVFTNRGSIPRDKLTSIFEKFYRLDSARSSDTGGAGLGLAIAKEIITQHGGNIYAESDENQTVFFVELPFTES